MIHFAVLYGVVSAGVIANDPYRVYWVVMDDRGDFPPLCKQGPWKSTKVGNMLSISSH